MIPESDVVLSLNHVSLRFPPKGFQERSVFNPRSWRRTSGSFLALDNVSLSLQPGSRLGIVGANGAGKTTLLRVMAGIFEPSEGDVYRRGSVGVVLDAGFGLDLSLTGRQNAKTVGVVMGLSPTQCRALVEDAQQFARLGPFFDRPVHTYSTGMVTRLVYALATSGRPDILIMDEALATGDTQFQEFARERSRTMMSSASILVVASHSAQFLREICDSGIFMHRGRVQAFGDLESVLEAYDRTVESA